MLMTKKESPGPRRNWPRVTPINTNRGTASITLVPYLAAVLPLQHRPLRLPTLPEVRSPRPLHDELGDVDVQVQRLVVLFQPWDLQTHDTAVGAAGETGVLTVSANIKYLRYIWVHS